MFEGNPSIESNQLQGLIFDVDGTLANTERDGHRVAFNQAFAEAGLDWHWSVEFYGELLAIAGGKERIYFYLDKYMPEFQPSPELSRLYTKRDFQGTTIANPIASRNLNDFVAYLHKLKTKYYLQLLRKGAIELRPGVKRLITEARQHNITLAIATTSSLPNVIALLEKYLDLDWFETIAAGDIVSAKKPAPDIYEYVLNRVKIPAQNWLVFEDSDNGLAAAREAGLKTIVTVNNYTETQNFSKAHLVVSNLGEPSSQCKVFQGNLYQDLVDVASLKKIINQAEVI